MESTWSPCGVHVESMVCRVLDEPKKNAIYGVHVESMWSCGVHVESMRTLWGRVKYTLHQSFFFETQNPSRAECLGSDTRPRRLAHNFDKIEKTTFQKMKLVIT